MEQEPAPQSTSPTLPPDKVRGILEGSEGSEVQKEALWHVIQTMINMTYDSAAVVTDGTVCSKGNLIFPA
jgi:hypothetical protein